jgi:hypothetical protein
MGAGALAAQHLRIPGSRRHLRGDLLGKIAWWTVAFATAQSLAGSIVWVSMNSWGY